MCIDDNDPPAGDSCAAGTDGLAGVVAAAASPDGRSLYTASVIDDAVAEFARSASGALQPRGCTDDDDAPLDACQTTADGLDGAFSIAVSPDGRSVYAAAFDDDAIVRFDRDTATGALSPQGCVDDNDAGQGPDDCAQQVDGLDGADAVAVSPDGRSVYATSMDDDAIVRFDRDLSTGALTPQGCVDDNDSGADDCAQATNGLDGARSIAISPEGDSVYVASGPDDALVRFSRDPQTGRLDAAGLRRRPRQRPRLVRADGGRPRRRARGVRQPRRRVGLRRVADRRRRRGLRAQRHQRRPRPDRLRRRRRQRRRHAARRARTASTAPSRSRSAPTGSRCTSPRSTTTPWPRSAATSRDGSLTSQGCIDDNDAPDGPDECARGADGLNGAVGVTSSAGTTSLYVLSAYDEAVLWMVRQDEDPPDTTVTRAPNPKTKKRRASFEFVSSEPFSTFECKLDKRGFKPCPSPRGYGKSLLKPGKHTFRVRALDEPGNTDPSPAQVRWKVRG